MKNITYGVGSDSFYARCGDRVAFFELDYNNMKPENNFELSFVIGQCDIFELHSSRFDTIRWTKKIPISIKNKFRKHFNLPELKMTPSYYLVIDIESGKYLSGSDGCSNIYTTSLSKALKFNNKQFVFPGNTFYVEMK